MWESFDTTLRTGVPAALQVLPEGSWKYLAEHPEERRIFDDAMTAKSRMQISAILRAYDFSPHACIADIGGGSGHLLRAFLAATTHATGVLFDLPHVIEAAAQTPADRLLFASGSFYTDRLSACDCYLLMHVLHDWNHDDASKILHAVRRAAPSNATLLVLESIVPADSQPSWERILGHMMAMHAGRERSRPEYAALLAAARVCARARDRYGRWRLAPGGAAGKKSQRK